MKRTQYARFLVLIAVTLSLLVPMAFAGQAGKSAKKEFAFRGKVEKVDGKSLVVNGEKVDGWMGAMTMTYVADKEDEAKKVKAGDQITAKVYEGDFRTLYNIQVVPPAKK
jgi:Cu/Ag efflux protein CusF